MKIDEKILALGYSNKKFAMNIVNTLNENYFGLECRWLYDALKVYFNNPNINDIPSRDMIVEYLSGDINTVQKLSKYDEIMALEVHENEFGWLVEKLRFIYNNDIQVNTIKKIANILKSQEAGKKRVEDVNMSLKESMVEIDSIHRRMVYKESSLKESVEERLKVYRYKKAHPEAAQGLLTGFTSFDQKTNGLHSGEFMIIAGATGTGKSILMHNIAVNAYLGKNDPFSIERKWDDSGCNVLYFSLEMPKESIERRIDACLGGIYVNHIRDGLLDEDGERQYLRTLKFQEEYHKHFHIVDIPRGATTREIELKYLEIVAAGWKPDLVVVDYMGIMSVSDSTGSDWKDLGIISEELFEFARVYELTVITGSQVNRTKDGQERYDNDRLARSAMVPTNASIVIQIGKRVDEYIRTDMPIYITKMREGEQDQFTLSKDFARMKVTDILDGGFGDDEDSELEDIV